MLVMDIWISFGNDKSKSIMQIAIANVACKSRMRPTFAFFVIPEGNPKPSVQTSIVNQVIIGS